MLRCRRPLLLALLAAACAPDGAGAESGPVPVAGETRPVVLVGNNWDGTTDVVDPYTLERLDRINVVPDLDERLFEIMTRPDRAAFFLAVREEIGEGHDQLNDDVFSSHDGRTIFVSRPSLADVVAIDLATKQIVWRAEVDGYRSDHMAISPDGTRLLVSASTGNVVHQIDTATGALTGVFESGDSPHESNYSKDGSLIYHASIGRVYTPTDRTLIGDTSKGARYFQVVDANTLEILKRIDMGKKLEEAGYPGMSPAIRPMALSPDEHFVYFQVSFFHGFVEYDLRAEKVTRVAKLPLSQEAADLQPEEYLLDSAHHGLAINDAGTKLCVAGTMSDYGAIVNRRTFAPKILSGIEKPYWATNSADGRYCYISASAADSVAVISYRTEKIVARFGVGDHPQRIRNGVARLDVYPGGPYGETFALGLFHERSPLSVRHGDERIGCRADGAVALRLSSCEVRMLARGKRHAVLARGERLVRDRRSFRVDVNLTKRGRRRLAAHPRGLRVTLVATGTDSVGRTQTVRRRVTIFRSPRGG